MSFASRVGKAYEVAAMPELIAGDDFELAKTLETPSSNLKMFESLTGKSTVETLETFKPNGSLMQVGQKIFLADFDKKKLQYFVQYEFAKLKGFKSITQIAVWGNISSSYMNVGKKAGEGFRLPTHTFFDILLPKADCLVSDRTQTKDGQKFWLARSRDALSLGLFVYAYFRDTNEIFSVTDTSQLDTLKPLLWGAMSSSARWRLLVISKKELFPEALKVSQ